MVEARKPLIVFGDRHLEWSLPLRKRLLQRGLRLGTAASAQSLLELVRQSRPELVVLGESLDELGGRLLASLIHEESPDTRIICILSPLDPLGGEPGPDGNVLCSMSRRASPAEFAEVIDRVLNCAPPRTPQQEAPLVICVDDDRQFLDSLARLIRRQGFRVMTYSEPELALEELPLLKPDLLILDVLMPGLSGFEVLDEIRRYYRTSLPVVLLSALDSDEKIAEGKELGAASYLTKPCAPEALMEILRSFLARSGSERKEMKTPGWVSREPEGGKARFGERGSRTPKRP
ncbi:MAG TPA: response regulator [Planctomycetota bacterium]|nr:response regulator [Planctomycetota bacterium]